MLPHVRRNILSNIMMSLSGELGGGRTWPRATPVLTLLVMISYYQYSIAQEGRLYPIYFRETTVLAVILILLTGALMTMSRRSQIQRNVIFLGLISTSCLLVVAYNDPFIIGIPFILILFIIGIRFVPLAIVISASTFWSVVIAALSRYQPIWTVPPGFEAQSKHIYVFTLFIVAPSLIEGFNVGRRYRLLREIASNLESSVDELSAANMSYNTFIQMAESQAARHERSRITREIHDGVGYALTNLIMLAESAHDLVAGGDDRVAERIVTIRNQARVALSDTRRALRELREAEQGLLHGQDALSHMMDVFEQATGVTTTREFLAPEGALRNDRIFPVVYRLVQEALTNSFRHGHATHVQLRIWLIEGALFVTVNDNGNAPPAISEGIGLQGMRERLGEIGGDLSYHAIKGFTIIARIPFKESEVTFA